MRTSTPLRRGIDLRDNNGIYRFKDRAYPSVTKILEGFTSWLFVERNAIKAEIARLLQMEADGEPFIRSWVDEETGEKMQAEVSPLDMLADGDFIAGAGARFLRAAADRGTIVHDALELWGSGARWSVDEVPDVIADIRNNHVADVLSCRNEDVLPYVTSLTHWLQSVSINAIFAEVPVFSDQYHYAGRLDLIAEVDGNLCVLDLKSTDSMKRAYIAQAAAYRYAEFAVEDPGIEVSLDILSGAGVGIILCGKDRCGLRVVSEGEAQSYFTQMFLPALQAWRSGATDEAIGGALPMPKSKATWVKHGG